MSSGKSKNRMNLIQASKELHRISSSRFILQPKHRLTQHRLAISLLKEDYLIAYKWSDENMKLSHKFLQVSSNYKELCFDSKEFIFSIFGIFFRSEHRWWLIALRHQSFLLLNLFLIGLKIYINAWNLRKLKMLLTLQSQVSSI